MTKKNTNNDFEVFNKITENEENNYKNLFDFISRFKEKYDKEKAKLPYHINLIDELHAGENAHSRILTKLLRQKNAENRFEFLESFIEFVIKKNEDKQDFQKIKISKPKITQEKKRIDLWIRDKDYAIVIENKVAWANDQTKQLERYIDITKEEDFSEEQIYVLYLSPTYEKAPDKQTWGKYFNNNIHKNRYLKLSFKDDILSWLKNSVLPNIKLKDKYLYSAIEQYIDHLEGTFSLRIINNQMNMELQEFIKKELGLIGLAPDNALEKVSEKVQEVQNAITQLNKLEKDIKVEYFEKWKEQLKKDFPNDEIVGWAKSDTQKIGIKIQLENKVFALLIGYDFDAKLAYYGIGRHKSSEKKYNDTQIFNAIISDLNLNATPDSEWWYVRQDTSFPNAYLRLKTLINKVKALTYDN